MVWETHSYGYDALASEPGKERALENLALKVRLLRSLFRIAKHNFGFVR